MKSIMYVGAALMIGASIYGFIDYRKVSKQKEFVNLYKPTPVTEEPVKVEQVDVPGNTRIAAVAPKKINTAKKRVLNYKLFSRAIPKEQVVNFVPPVVKKDAVDKVNVKEGNQ